MLTGLADHEEVSGGMGNGAEESVNVEDSLGIEVAGDEVGTVDNAEDLWKSLDSEIGLVNAEMGMVESTDVWGPS